MLVTNLKKKRKEEKEGVESGRRDWAKDGRVK